jgi:hypothetical protein
MGAYGRLASQEAQPAQKPFVRTKTVIPFEYVGLPRKVSTSTSTSPAKVFAIVA